MENIDNHWMTVNEYFCYYKLWRSIYQGGVVWWSVRWSALRPPAESHPRCKKGHLPWGCFPDRDCFHTMDKNTPFFSRGPTFWRESYLPHITETQKALSFHIAPAGYHLRRGTAIFNHPVLRTHKTHRLWWLLHNYVNFIKSSAY